MTLQCETLDFQWRLQVMRYICSYLVRPRFLLKYHHLSLFLMELMLQNKQNLHTLSKNIKFICIQHRTGQKCWVCLIFLPVFKLHTNKSYTPRQCMYILYIQWNCAPECFDILWHLTKMYGPKVFLLTKIKAYFNVLYNQTHFPGSLLCCIRQVPLYLYSFDKIKIKFIGNYILIFNCCII